MRESEFIDAYLNIDEDGDYVGKKHLAPFWAKIILQHLWRKAFRL